MNDNPSIIAIVEGPGEKAAVPGLVRRILWEWLYRHDISNLKAIPANGKPNLLKKFEKFLEYAISEKCAAILVVLDADSDCPQEKASVLVEKATALNLNVPVAIVYARSEYETWFICSLSQDKGKGIRERLRIPESVTAPSNVEDIRDAKGWLNRNMPSHVAYKETSDQEHLTHHIDLELVHSESRSFRRLCHAVEELVHAIDNRESIVTPQTQ